MDEVLFRSSQKLENLQVQLSLAASQSKDLLQQYSKQSKSAVLQALETPHAQQFKQHCRQLWEYGVAVSYGLKEQIVLHVNPKRIYKTLARIFWRRWTKRDVYFLAAGFILGTATGAILVVSLRKQSPIYRYMQAVRVGHYLGIESASVVEDAIAPNECGDQDVLINVKAASVQVVDAQICNGYGRTLRRILRGLHKSEYELPVTLGRDCSGIVTDVGRDVKRLEVGDEVWACVPFWHDGTLSQTLLLPEHRVGRKPKNAGYEGACSLPYAGCVALGALRDASITPENAKLKRVLVQGGCTPVGCFLVQILCFWQADVTAICYKRAVPVARALGAADVIIFPTPDAQASENRNNRSEPTASPQNDTESPDESHHFLKELELRDRFDCVIMTRDCVMTPEDSLSFFSKDGTVISTLPQKLPSDSCGVTSRLVLGTYIRIKHILERILGVTIDCYDETHMCHIPLDEICELVENGSLQTVVDKVFHSQDIEIALSHIQSSESIGSTVITFR